MHSPGGPWIVVLAAGEGSRVRFLTRDRGGRPAPKQFSVIDGRTTLIEATIDRARRIGRPERIVIVVASEHRRWWQPELSGLRSESIIVQPTNRGTAAGILLPLLWILQRDPNGRILILPSDHGVSDERRLLDTIEDVISRSPSAPDEITLLGMQPDRPETDYGWILPNRRDASAPFRVSAFHEKPDARTALDLYCHGGLLNSFILVSPCRSLCREFRQVTAGLWRSFRPIRRLLIEASPEEQRLERHYRSVPHVDFSKDLLERIAPRLRVWPVPQCGWLDLGSPDRLVQHMANLERDWPSEGPASTRGDSAKPPAPSPQQRHEAQQSSAWLGAVAGSQR
jgi:mannose-1-phosphate guanylyltransferase